MCNEIVVLIKSIIEMVYLYRTFPYEHVKIYIVDNTNDSRSRQTKKEGSSFFILYTSHLYLNIK